MAINISACIIAKNEEKNLPRLLESLKGKFDEIILVDTGSTDKTVEIAKQYGCKVYHRQWQGFADARNYAVSKASGEWIWHFDADFELEEEEWRKALYHLKRVPEDIDAVSILIKNVFTNVKGFAISSNTFIHRNKSNIKWIGKVHETLDVKQTKGIPVFVKHYGYQDYDILEKKAYRNIKLIQEELSELPENSTDYFIKLFYLVQSYSVLAMKNPEYWKKVVHYAEKFIHNLPEEVNFFSIYIYVYLIEGLMNIKEYDKAEKTVLEAKKKFPDYLDILFLEAKLYTELKDYNKAADSYLRFISLIDKFKDNPFYLSKGMAFASDKLANIVNYIENTIPEIIKKSNAYNTEKLAELWKKEKGEYLGLLLIETAIIENKKIDKLVNKIVNLYNNSSNILLQAIKYAYKSKNKELENKFIKRLQKISPQNEMLLYYSGNKYFGEGNYQEALNLFYQYFLKTKDINIIPKIRECLINLDLKEELKKFDEEINNLTKKLKTTSDNKTQQKQNRR